ncbi:hypothetical protein ACH5RR_020709 [Cinchona calisaya]|uniref:Serine/threonine-protein kinase BSK1-like TPR repeats domain-containing protein n=1 Tax=Cinchona calisaya TaxID=153742 RepID=A0ABD2ZF85_9GENT
MWTGQIQETLNSRKRGDTAFRSKDFATAISCYTDFIEGGTTVSPTVLARRCLCYLMNNRPQEALADAMQSQATSRHGQLHFIYKQLPSLAWEWTATPKRLLKMAHLWKTEDEKDLKNVQIFRLILLNSPCI